MTTVKRDSQRILPSPSTCCWILIFCISSSEAFSQQRVILSKTGVPRQRNHAGHLLPQDHTAALRPRSPRAPSLYNSLIPADDVWGNVAFLMGSATGAQWLGSNTFIGKLLGAPVTAMAVTFGMASMGVLAPGGTSASKQLQWLALNLATPLILLGADLDDCWKRCGSLLLSFALAASATVVACLVGWKVAGKSLQVALGAKDGLAIAAALMAKNIGGGINYIAVCRALQASPQAIAAGLCIDNLAALVYFPATNAIGSGRPDAQVEEDVEREAATNDSADAMTVPSISMAMFASCGLLWLGERIADGVFKNASAQLPLCTLLTVIAVGGISATAGSNTAKTQPLSFSKRLQSQVERLRPTCNVLGTTLLYIFFSTAGAPGSQVADSVKSSILPLSKFLLCLYGIHGGILWTCHKLFWRGNEPNSWRSAFLPQRLLVASSSAIGGPATSVALAESNGWKSLIVPAILVGNIGYVIATFCGLAYYYGLL